MVELLGWISTLLVMMGYVFNSVQKRLLAIGTWIMGDVGWIIYDIYIKNWSHSVLSLLIIVINIYGIWNITRET